MKVWLELIEPILRRSRVTLKGDKTDDLLPMNPEGVELDVSQCGHPLNPRNVYPLVRTTLNMQWIRILEFLWKRGESELKEIAKNIRVPEVVVKSEVERMKEKGFVNVDNEKVKISEKGLKELQKYVKRV